MGSGGRWFPRVREPGTHRQDQPPVPILRRSSPCSTTESTMLGAFAGVVKLSRKWQCSPMTSEPPTYRRAVPVGCHRTESQTARRIPGTAPVRYRTEHGVGHSRTERTPRRRPSNTPSDQVRPTGGKVAISPATFSTAPLVFQVKCSPTPAGHQEYFSQLILTADRSFRPREISGVSATQGRNARIL